MDNQKLLDLVDRIGTDPSVLFLGQDYLLSYNMVNPFLDAVNRDMCNGNIHGTPSYNGIWEAWKALGCTPLDDERLEQMRKIAEEIPTQNWLRQILNLGWGMVYTSAIDSCMTNCVGSIRIESLSKREMDGNFRTEYMNKRAPRSVYLWGAVDGGNDDNTGRRLPLRDWSEKGRLKGGRKVATHATQWIYDRILKNTGVLVIDGWNPLQDWEDNLLEGAVDMRTNSIYLFGARSEWRKRREISVLEDDGILVTCELTFAQALSQVGVITDDYDAEEDEWTERVAEGRQVTVNSRGKGKPIYLTVPDTALMGMDRVTLFHDNLGREGAPLNPAERSENFARYLQQGTSPDWKLCTIEAGFHFQRDIDEQLLRAVIRELGQTPGKRKTIVLYGVANSGKTAAMIHLGMTLREKHWVPILFIRASSNYEDFTESLKTDLIKPYLVGTEDNLTKKAQSVVILWDNNSSIEAVSNYIHLANSLRECNALVVGTAYRRPWREDEEAYLDDESKMGQVEYIPIKDELPKKELDNLQALLHNTDEGLLGAFNALLQERTDGAHSDELDWRILDIFQQLANYTHFPQWREVKREMDRHIFSEYRYQDEAYRQAIRSFVENYTEAHNMVSDYGIGAEAIKKLRELLDSMSRNARTANDVPVALSEDNKKRKQIYRDLRLINRVLAMAGQFSSAVSEDTLISLIRRNHEDGKLLPGEDRFLEELLKYDLLIAHEKNNAGYAVVRFRHPYEAEIYVNHNFLTNGEDEDWTPLGTIRDENKCWQNGQEQTIDFNTVLLRRREVSLLRDAIEACAWDKREESQPILNLARCFGTNSNGKYSEQVSPGQYQNYLPYMLFIADVLIKANHERLGDVVVVYAHFLREAYQAGWGEQSDLTKARVALDAALGENKTHKGLYSKLIVEYCANLVTSMKSESKASKPEFLKLFRELKEKFDEAVKNWPLSQNQKDTSFSTNNLLDIWLNAMERYSEILGDEKLHDTMFKEELSNSLEYIQQLLDIYYQFRSPHLLDKIEHIYTWANQSLQQLRDALEESGNDTWLYLKASYCWRPEEVPAISGLPESMRKNLYLLPDDPDRLIKMGVNLRELKPHAIAAAQRTIETLSANRTLVLDSGRCLYMLIRAKWLTMTGNFLLEEKQRVGLNQEQWEEIFNLCEQYMRVEDPKAVRQSVCLLDAIYLWAFKNDPREAAPKFRESRRLGGERWLIERIGLCHPQTRNLREFYVHVRVEQNVKAQIYAEQTDNGHTNVSCKGTDIHVPPHVQEYLFHGQKPCTQHRLNKPVTLWFSSNGPLLGLPSEGGESSE